MKSNGNVVNSGVQRLNPSMFSPKIMDKKIENPIQSLNKTVATYPKAVFLCRLALEKDKYVTNNQNCLQNKSVLNLSAVQLFSQFSRSFSFQRFYYLLPLFSHLLSLHPMPSSSVYLRSGFFSSLSYLTGYKYDFLWLWDNGRDIMGYLS